MRGRWIKLPISYDPAGFKPVWGYFKPKGSYRKCGGVFVELLFHIGLDTKTGIKTVSKRFHFTASRPNPAWFCARGRRRG
jgi:hypothetical protein